MKYKIALIVALMAGVTLALSANLTVWQTIGQQSNGYKAFKDLPYAARDASRNLLDLYVPEQTQNPPIVMYIHGGAYKFGDKASPPGLEGFIDAGIAVASMTYRFSDTTQWPGQYHDLSDAFSFLRAHSNEYGFDATRIGSMGGSAGGHLAAIAGIAFSASDETRLTASVIWFPAILFSKMDEDAARIGMPHGANLMNGAGSWASQLIGKPVGTHPDLAYAASPLAYLDQLPANTKLPAFLVLHGTRDLDIARGQSGRLFAALLDRPTIETLEYRLVRDMQHGNIAFEDKDLMQDVVQWFKQQFEQAR